jgi:NADH:ubiquinone oxidoreductase subunit 6 (subunit J)
MSKGLALYFAIAGTALLAASAGSLSFRNPFVSVLLFALTIVHIGCGFIVRAKLRKKG